MNLQEEDQVISAYQMDSPESAEALTAKPEIFLNDADTAMPLQWDMSEQVHDSYDGSVETTNNNFTKLRAISLETLQTYLPFARWGGTFLFLLMVLFRNIRFAAYCRKTGFFTEI